MRGGFGEDENESSDDNDVGKDGFSSSSSSDAGDGFYEEIEMKKKETINIYDAKYKIPNTQH